MAQKSRKQKRSRMRRSRRQGGAYSLSGAPLNGKDDLAGGYSSQLSKGQGMDFFKYHRAQHGGQASLAAIGGDLLPKGLEQAAGTAALSRAFDQIAGMRDQTGGRRKSRRSKSRRSKSRRSKSRRSKSKSRHGKSKSKSKSRGGRRSKSRRSKSRRHRGGAALSFAPFPSSGMILDSGLVDKAGLNPGWRGGVEMDAARARQEL